MKLNQSLTYEIKPIPPYNFNLTVRKPAGWPLLTPLEIYDRRTLWTAVHLYDIAACIPFESKY